MLTVWGQKQHTCDGIARRDFRRVGALGLGGITLADVLARAPSHPADRVADLLPDAWARARRNSP